MEFPFYICMYCFSCCYFAQFGLRQLGPPVPKPEKAIHQNKASICDLNHAISNGSDSKSRAAKRDLSFLFLSFFVLFGTFPIFLGFSRFARGWSGDFPDSSLFLFLGLLRAPTRNSPERVRDTIWTFPKKSGKHPGLETPRFSFSQNLLK